MLNLKSRIEKLERIVGLGVKRDVPEIWLMPYGYSKPCDEKMLTCPDYIRQVEGTEIGIPVVFTPSCKQCGKSCGNKEML